MLSKHTAFFFKSHCGCLNAGLEQGLSNLHTAPSLPQPCLFVNKVLLGRSRAQLSPYCPQLLLHCGGRVETETVWTISPKISLLSGSFQKKFASPESGLPVLRALLLLSFLGANEKRHFPSLAVLLVSSACTRRQPGALSRPTSQTYSCSSWLLFKRPQLLGLRTPQQPPSRMLLPPGGVCSGVFSSARPSHEKKMKTSKN